MIDPTGHKAEIPPLLDIEGGIQYEEIIIPHPKVLPGQTPAARIDGGEDKISRTTNTIQPFLPTGRYREWYSNGVFRTDDDAAYAFAKEALPMTNADQRESGAVIYKVEVEVVDINNNIVSVDAYTYGDIFTGMHNNIVFNVIVNILAKDFILHSSNDYLSNDRISLAHTHPNCSHGGLSGTERFSTGLISDETVARWYTVDKFYMAESRTGTLYVFDELNTPYEDDILDGLPRTPIVKYT